MGEVKPIPQAPPEVAVGIPAELIRRRPDIRRAELDAAAQSAQIGVAKADIFPAFSLTGSFGLESSAKGGMPSNKASFRDLFNANSFTYFVGPTFEWPILNYGRLKNNIRAQDARFQQLVVNYQQTVLRAAQEVEDAIVAFLRSQEQVKLLADSVEASKRAVDLSMIQYREGKITYNEVLNAQQFLVQEEGRLTKGRGDIARNLIAVHKALGGGWEIRKGKDFIPEEIKKEMQERTGWGDLVSREEIEDAPHWQPDF
jgi:outer membrane protein TolC